LQRLAAGGATLGLLAANTPHLVFDQLARTSPLPLISIVEAACDESLALGFKRPGLIGTRLTMAARFYPDVFATRGLTIVAPGEDEQTYIHDKYTKELLKGVVSSATRDGLLRIIDRLRERDDVDSVVLGGTELSLLFDEHVQSPVPLLDTTQIHA